MPVCREMGRYADELPDADSDGGAVILSRHDPDLRVGLILHMFQPGKFIEPSENFGKSAQYLLFPVARGGAAEDCDGGEIPAKLDSDRDEPGIRADCLQPRQYGNGGIVRACAGKMR